MRKKQDSEIEVFTAFMTDIEKTLHSKLNIDPSTLLPEHFHHKLKLFQSNEAEKLSPLQEPSIDHKIELEKVNNKDSKTS